MKRLGLDNGVARTVAAMALSCGLGAGCRGDDGDGDAGTSAASQDGDGDGGNGDGGTVDSSGGGGGDSGFDDSSWEGTAFPGDIEASVTFTYSAPHLYRANGEVGIVAGYRPAEVSFPFEDLYSPVIYQLPFPDPPSVDTTRFDDVLPAFDFGAESDWIAAGNGLQLRPAEGEGFATACLENLEVLGEDGTSTYSIYLTGALGHENCDPTPDVWTPGGLYDVVLFGGELYADHELLGRVVTPAALELTSPNFAATNVVIDTGDGLALAWTAAEGDTRIIIRVIDSEGSVLTAHAADDGSYTISSGDLGMLFPGPIDVIVAREREDRMLFSEGGITVKSRHEQWGFFELQ